MTDRYVELHGRSAFSFLTGASLPEEMVSRSAGLDLPAMALLDRNGVYGAPQFHVAAKKQGIRAHIGAEIVLDDGAVLPLLARNMTGYRNLCRLITRMKLRAEKGGGAAAYDELAAHAEGLICLTGGEQGPLAASLAPLAPLPPASSFQRSPGRDSRTRARGSINPGLNSGLDCVSRLADIFGKDNVYVELQRHYDRAEEARNSASIQIARRARLPLLATNDASYASPSRRELLDVLTCIRNHVRLAAAGRLLSKNSERYLKSAAEMSALFSDLPDAMANTVELSSRLDFTMEDLGYEFPKYPVPDGETAASFLRKRTEEGARARYTGKNGAPDFERGWRQIERELRLIDKLGLCGYFLIVWDIVNFCRDNGILAQGRGSAANSAVCYSLGITAVDPVGMELLFERFLSEERGEWPDIDLDLPSGDRRELVIQYVYQRYGQLGAAMTANVITYRGRSAAREVGKVMGFDPAAVDRLAKLASTWEWTDPKDTHEKRFAEAGLDLDDHCIAKFFDVYLSILDLPRHLGQHSGGMIVCQGQLDSVVPLEPATMPDRVVVQWDKDDCANMGIIKIDLLGLGMMAVLQDSLAVIKDTYGDEVDLAHLPQRDPAVYSALRQADTVGMFQVESRAQMSCLPRLKPERFYDIVVQVAIIRPGPIVGKMLHPYIKRRQGLEAPDCLHPSLEPVLERTLGVPLFQEQLLRIAMICAGFTGGQAEELRRAMGFKRSALRMRDIEVKLREGMNRNNIIGEVQDRIVQAITSFALYGFPESHAASFALIAYASAYLKCHYLAAFTATILNNQPMGFYSPLTILKDAQRHGLKIKPIDVTRSDWLCTVEEDSGEKVLRLGLLYVRGLRAETGQKIVDERLKRRFIGVEDLRRRAPGLRKNELRSLAEIGALNGIGRENGAIHRRSALWQVELALRPSGPLFDELEIAEKENVECPLEAMTPAERLNADLIRTGFTIGCHPMAYLRADMDRLGVTRAADLVRVRNNAWVKIAGAVIARQRPGSAKGFLFMSLEDETGLMNAIATPDFFDQNRQVLTGSAYLVVEGPLQNLDGVLTVKARNVFRPSLTPAATLSHDFR